MQKGNFTIKYLKDAMVIIIKIDTGDGYYDPDRGTIFSYDNKLLRYPNEDEEEWIKLKCRYNPVIYENINYNDELNGMNDVVIKNILREYMFTPYKKEI